MDKDESGIPVPAQAAVEGLVPDEKVGERKLADFRLCGSESSLQQIAMTAGEQLEVGELRQG